MKKLISAVALVLFLSQIVYAGLFGDSDEDLIKSLKGQRFGGCGRTIGEMLGEENFTEPKFRVFEAQSGRRIVEFTGKVTKLLNARKFYSLVTAYGSDVVRQMALQTLPDKERLSTDNPTKFYFNKYVWAIGSETLIQFTKNEDGSFSMIWAENKTFTTYEKQHLDQIWRVLCLSN